LDKIEVTEVAYSSKRFKMMPVLNVVYIAVRLVMEEGRRLCNT